MPFLLLLALFIGVPIIELSLLFKVGAAIGGLKTVLFVIFTAVLGAYLVKQQGMATYMKFQQEANSGRLPAQQMLEGIALLFAGAVLLTPGFITDAIGFVLLVPSFRQAIIATLIRNGRFVGGMPDPSSSQNNTRGAGNPNVIEGEYSSGQEEQK
ncbi:membrane protein FxsA [Arenicella sp. 4NH20-0111]|uniref:FxsA family protein n=1 Tax=Arenicella sp. 4NH20-0111 TaxID=3127648 RepID=UPI0031073085